jgi:hypothetical protein
MSCLCKKGEALTDLFLRASAFHYQIDCQILFDNCHLNFGDVETRKNETII